MNNKKGFTLVELVIVIAVIAILAGVMIGTFATVVDSANKSKKLQEWRAAVDAAYLEYVANHNEEPTVARFDGESIEFISETDQQTGDYILSTTSGTLYVELAEGVYLIKNASGFRCLTGSVENNLLTFEGGTATLATQVPAPTNP